MNLKVLLVVFSLLALLAADPAAVLAQQSSQDKPSPGQWSSHQMNQPPPTFSDKKLSEDILDELRELYELAKREADAKAVKKPADKK